MLVPAAKESLAALGAVDAANDGRAYHAHHAQAQSTALSFTPLLHSARDGTQLHAKVFGEAPPVLLFLHGFGDSGAVWTAYAEQLAERVGSLVVDFRGHGDSGWASPQTYTGAAYAEDVSGLIRSVQMQRVVIVGHSVGGETAIRLATEFEARVVGLVLVDYRPGSNAASKGQVRDAVRARFRRFASPCEYAALLERQLPLTAFDLLHRVASSDLRKTQTGRYELKADPSIATADMHGNPALIWELMSSLTCPILHLRGAYSSFVPPSMVSSLQKVMRNGECQAVPHAGHALMLDNPREFSKRVDDFLARLGVLSETSPST